MSGSLSTVYIGSFTDPGLAAGSVDDATGELAVGASVDVAHASFLALNADRTRLYATNEQDDGGVTALDVTDPANPVVLNSQSSRGSTPTHVSVHPSGSYLLTANYGDGTVVVHRIAEDGSLGESTDLVQHQGTDREPHAHQIVTDPSGQWVLAVDLGTDSVYVYGLDTDAGTLTQQQQLALPTGAGPRHLAFNPAGTLAYVLGELRAEITVCAWDPAGQLTAGQVIPTVSPDAPDPNHPSEIAVSSDGRFVYAANRGENTIATFSASGDQLTHLGNTPCGGDWPRHFTLSPDETSVYVSNQNANSINVLPRDPETGLLSESTASTEIEAPGIVLF